MRKSLLLAAAAVSSLLTANASATITVYTTQASYLAAISGAQVDSFDDLPAGELADSLARSVGPYNYTVSGINGDVAVPLFGAGSGSDRWLSVETANNFMAFDQFSSNVSAIGGFFFSTDQEGAAVVAPLGLFFFAIDDDGAFQFNTSGATPSSFVGFVSNNKIAALLFSPDADETTHFVTANNITLGVAIPGGVPEPATWAMMVAGLGLVGAAMRRRATMANFA